MFGFPDVALPTITNNKLSIKLAYIHHQLFKPLDSLTHLLILFFIILKPFLQFHFDFIQFNCILINFTLLMKPIHFVPLGL